MEDILKEVLSRIKPKDEERNKVRQIFEEIKNRIEEKAKSLGINVRVELEGSVAKDTWISTDKDIDIFILFPYGTDKNKAKEIGLEIAKYGAGENWKIAYAEHPYIKKKIDEYEVDIVPGIEIKEGERPLTAVDRTPLHTKFIKSKMNEEMKDEVRLLKQFMKGIGVYGAELKIEGFSGYLCELLVLYYKNFKNVIKNASNWRQKTIIDYMNYYKDIPCEEIFDAPLIVIDPIDRRRNVAAAVSLQSYSIFVMASKFFLEKPSIEFFFPSKLNVNLNDIINEIKKREISLVMIKMKCPKIPSDILWGEIKKTINKFVKLIENYDFEVIDYKAWSDEENIIIFLIEVEKRKLRRGKIHQGPKIWYDEDLKKFLDKYINNEKVLAGPFIKNERIYVEILRKYNDIKDLLINEIKNLKLSKDIMNEINKGFEVYVDEEILKECEGIEDEIFSFIRKKPLWLK
jgi:tRNA nucleotidyltransferase (CCA-adding enzyme)